jgi:hypothetical protein
VTLMLACSTSPYPLLSPKPKKIGANYALRIP